MIPLFKKIIAGEPINILGLMSGTSCDGLDMALVKIQNCGIKSRFSVIETHTSLYSDSFKKQLLKFINTKSHFLPEISTVNFTLAKMWVQMIDTFLHQKKIDTSRIDVIASHGQTIWHQPESFQLFDLKTTSTLQLGDPSVLANVSGIPVVGDFRVADMAMGGQGAPLIPFFDWIYFSKYQKNILSLNIGGISNLTFIPANGKFNNLKAYDCGPGNMLIDGLCQKLINREYDKDGQVAFAGKKSEKLFSFLIEADTFAAKTPPKSTGRELYNQDFINRILSISEKLNLNNKDIIHTISEYTVYAIFQSCQNYLSVDQLDEIVVGGGGSRNRFLMDRLQRYFNNVKVSTTEIFDLNEDYKEAIGFAIMANETLHGNPSNVPSASGASKKTILGKICLV